MIRKFDKKLSGKIDLIDTISINLFFLLIIIFAYGHFEEEIINFFIVVSIMIGSIIGYYTNITYAILYSILFNFIYASLHIFLYITKAIPIDAAVYFWMVILPVFSITSAYKGKLIKDVQIENLTLRKENTDYVMVDKSTGLRNEQSFFSEIQGYINISKRYGLIANLMLVKIKYENEVIRILGKSEYDKVIKLLSKEIDHMLREEDKKYILRDSNMFGIVFLTQSDDGELVKNRLKNKIQSITFDEESLINKVKLEVILGLVSYDRDENKDKAFSAYEFFQTAEKDMEYDV